MTIKLQGTWEAERVARIVEMWNPVNDDLIPWRDDCVKRMRAQIDGSYAVARCLKESACDGCRHWHVSCDIHGNCGCGYARTDEPRKHCKKREEGDK